MWGKRLTWLVLVAALLGSSAAVGSPTSTRVHFTAAGDYGQNLTATAKVLEAVSAAGPDLNLALGDLSYGVPGGEQSWCDFVTSRVGAGFPFELLSGNHESNGQNGNINDFASCLPNQLPGVVGTYGRQYYVDVPEKDPLVRFVMISPDLTFPDGTWSYPAGSARYKWTAAAIDGARSARIPWTVVSMHKPCLSVGEYACGPGPDLTNLLLAKKVDLVLTGHEHLYMRTKQLSLGQGCETLTIGSYNPSCVTDSDTDMVARAGTVFITAGTGGQPLREVNLTDPELPYFAATSGLNVEPTYGSADVVATRDALTIGFLQGAGSSFADAFTITRDPNGPENYPPSAFFGVSVVGQSAVFDASSATDVDGTITQFAWDFGDAQSGSGVAPTHTYAQAGTYQVTLTTTDDAGATGTLTKQVVIEEPPPAATIVRASTSTSVNTTAAPTVSVTKPTGTAPGDVLVSCLTLNGGRVASGGVPAGWAPIASVTGVANPHVFGYYKVAGDTEPASYQWTLSSSLVTSGGIARYTGASGLDGPASTNAGPSTVSATIPGVQTTSPSAMLVGCAGINSGAMSVGINAPALMTQAWDIGGKRQELDDQLLSAAGSTGSRTWTFSAGREWAGWLVALRPRG